MSATFLQFAFAERPLRATSRSNQAHVKLKGRFAVLSEIVELRQAPYELGESTFDEILLSQSHLLDAELELAATTAERITILERLVSIAKQREEYATQLAQEHAISKTDLLTRKTARLRAEANLFREQKD